MVNCLKYAKMYNTARVLPGSSERSCKNQNYDPVLRDIYAAGMSDSFMAVAKATPPASMGQPQVVSGPVHPITDSGCLLLTVSSCRDWEGSGEGVEQGGWAGSVVAAPTES